jgi:hypothetical protein
VVKNKKGAGHQGKPAAATMDAHSSDTNANKDVILVLNVKKSVTQQGKTGQGVGWLW